MKISSKKTYLSLDIWNFILVNNPNFKKIFNNWFSNKFNKSIEEIEKIQKNIKILDEIKIQNTGFGFTSSQTFSYLFSQLNISSVYLTEVLLKYEELYLENLPYFKTETTLQAIQKLSEHFILGIGSNTLNCGGLTQIKALQKLEIKQYFDYFLFSDLLKINKPNPKFFKFIKEIGDSINLKSYHLGDSIIHDSSDLIQTFIFKEGLTLENSSFIIKTILEND